MRVEIRERERCERTGQQSADTPVAAPAAAHAPHPTGAEAKAKAEGEGGAPTRNRNRSAYTHLGEIDRLTTRAYVDDKKKYMRTQTLRETRPVQARQQARSGYN